MKQNTNLYILLLIVFALLGFVLYTQFATTSTEKQKIPWKQIVDEKDGITIEVQPTKLSHEENSEFTVVFTTHQGSLDFDPAKISILQDNNGQNYQPITWEGSPTGGHHRNGKLTFPKIKDNAMEVKLLIKIDKNERKFEWSLH